MIPISRIYSIEFLLTRPSRGATGINTWKALCVVISTHTPLAGRDSISDTGRTTTNISTHTPLAGRDTIHRTNVQTKIISTHTPLAGRDNTIQLLYCKTVNFYSHAPRGARLQRS